MGPDYFFIGVGAVAALTALFVLIRAFRTRSRRNGLSAVLWACLATGFFLQGFAPNLKINQNRFVVPSAAMRTQSPKELVDRDRMMKLLSAVFTLTAAVGLVLQNRHLFTNSARPSGSGQTAQGERAEA